MTVARTSLNPAVGQSRPINGMAQEAFDNAEAHGFHEDGNRIDSLRC